MRRTVSLSLIAFALIAAIGWQIRAGYAIPPSITISGVLKGADSAPLTGSYSAEVKFYRTQTDTEAVDTRSATVQVIDGVFSISLIPDPSLLEVDDLWYSLAVDSNGDGLDSGDLFPDRFQVTSVPFALAAKPKPVTFFNSHGGVTQTWSVYVIPGIQYWDRRLLVSPFVTPPEGVQFNRMTAYFGENLQGDAFTYSFGIYDRYGNRLYVSDPIPYVADSFPLKQVAVPDGHLEPSTKYYTGWTFLGAYSPLYGGALVPPVADTGYVQDFSLNGVVPETFYTGNITFYNRGALNVLFEMVGDETIYGTSGLSTGSDIQKMIDADATGR